MTSCWTGLIPRPHLGQLTEHRQPRVSPGEGQGWAEHAQFLLPSPGSQDPPLPLGSSEGRVGGEESLGLRDQGGGDAGYCPDTLFFPLFGSPLPVALAADTATTRLW